jgi:predicted metal-dependent hydrolase
MLRAFLDDQQDWIQRTLNQLEPQRQRLEQERSCLPETLELLAIDRNLRIKYRDTRSARTGLMETGDKLILSGQVDNIDLMRKALGRYVRDQARTHLGHELDQLSQKHDLSYTGISIRRQKTRWGSCSASGRINLNDKLLFLPRPLMQHVLLHELAHTRHMDHSQTFHRLLQSLDPDSRRHNQALQQAGQYVPLWLRWA